jgi:hypothetical protein
MGAAEWPGGSGDRTTRMSEEAPIPYSAWAILCDIAGFERIWLEAEMRIAPERTDSGEDTAN